MPRKPPQGKKVVPAGARNSRSTRPAFVEGTLSTNEKAVVTRLVRVLREPDYWLGAFIEWILQADAGATAEGIGPKVAGEKLDELCTAMAWLAGMKPTKDAALLRCIGHRYFPDHLDKLNARLRENIFEDANQDEAFGELVRMWRLEHPEPPKRIQHPTGHLGREESGD